MLRPFRRAAALGLAVLALALVQPQERAITLVVIVTVDQFRADYVDRFRHQWTGGLRRLFDEGAWFPNAAFPYLNTVTCAGHASIGTGTVPAVHGSVLNKWFDRNSGRLIECTEDPSVQPVGYDGAPRLGHSAVHLRMPTLGDEMRMQLSPPARVVSMSLKARSAIMLAGHRADAVTWFDDVTRTWSTSTAFSAAPVPYLARFFAEDPVAGYLGRVWTRSLPVDAYAYDDSEMGRTPLAGWGPALPHALTGRSGKPDNLFYDQWQASPFSDEYLARMALASVDALSLGRGPGADLLAISFSALDKIGHDVGPLSHQVQDVLVRLDQTLGRLLDGLAERVGEGRYVVALTADHGVSPIPEQMAAAGLDAGRIVTRDMQARLEAALAARLGEGRYVERVEYSDIYLRPGVHQRLRDDKATFDAIIDLLHSYPGVLRVYRGDDLVRANFENDPAGRAAALSYFPGRSGDLIVVPRPYWITSVDAATHGTGHQYDARVPVVFKGPAFRTGRYLQPASPVDVAPTLAFVLGVTMSGAEGRVLHEALEPVLPVPAPPPPPLTGSQRP